MFADTEPGNLVVIDSHDIRELTFALSFFGQICSEYTEYARVSPAVGHRTVSVTQVQTRSPLHLLSPAM